MNVRRNRQSGKRFERGITVMEVLIALGLLVVLVSFASPTLSGATARAELKAATENVDLSVRMARSAARQFSTPVVMQIVEDTRTHEQVITFAMPEAAENAVAISGLLDYQLPESVRWESKLPDVSFDDRGMVKRPLQVELVSLLDDDLTHRLVVE